MPTPPLVSVVIPAFNRERYVGQAVCSALDQTHRNVEVIVIDDGSTDGTIAAIEAIRDERLRLIRQPGNRGVSAARNAGIAAAGGEFIAFLDSDDAMYPERIERQVGAFREDPALTICGTGTVVIDEEGREVRVPWVPIMGDYELKWHGLWGPSTHMPTVMVRRGAIMERGVLFDEALDLGEDFDFTSRVLYAGRGDNVSAPLTMAREHPNSSLADRNPECVNRLNQTITKMSVRNMAMCGIGITETTAFLIRAYKQGDFAGYLGHLSGKDIQKIKDAFDSVKSVFSNNYRAKHGIFA